jgi:hypothetical protein
LAASNNSSQSNAYLFRNYKTNGQTTILPLINSKIKLIDCLMSCISPLDEQKNICDGNIKAFNPTEFFLIDLDEVLFFFFLLLSLIY